MAVKLWGFSIGADNRPAQKAFGEIPVFAAKSGKQAGTNLNKGVQQGLGPLGKIIGGLSPAMAPLVERTNKVAAGMTGISGSAAGAALAVGGIGLAAGAAIFSVVALTHKAAALSKELRPFAEAGLLPVSSLDNVKQADAAMMSILRVGQATAVVMADELAPSVERVSVDLVALGLYGLDALGGVENATKSLTVWMGQHLVKGLTGPAYLLSNIARGGLYVAESFGQQVPAIRTALDAYDDWTRSIAERGIDLLVDQLENAETAGASYIDRARKIVDVQASIGQKAGQAKKHVDALALSMSSLKDQLGVLDDVAQAARDIESAFGEWSKAYTDLNSIATDAAMALLTPEQRITAELDAQIVKVNELAVATGDYALASQATASLQAASAKQLADVQIAEQARVAQARQQVGMQILSGVQSLADAEVQERGKAASGAVALSKTAGIAQVGIATAEAVASALKLGPIFGPIAGGILAGLGAIQAGKIAATPVPSYATGYVPSRMGEGMAYIDRENEAVLNSRGTRKMGREAIRDANNGRSPSSLTEITIDGATLAATTTRRIGGSARDTERVKRISDSGRLGQSGRARYQ
jgi:hypothetical protein